MALVATLREKLRQLKPEQAAIVELSDLMRRTVSTRQQQDHISMWLDAARTSTDPEHLLALIYLSNDIVQHLGSTRRLRLEFKYQFFAAIVHVFASLQARAPSIVLRARRMVSIWIQRSVFDKEAIACLHKALEGEDVHSAAARHAERQILENFPAILSDIQSMSASVSASETEGNPKQSAGQSMEWLKAASARASWVDSLSAAAGFAPLLFPEIAKKTGHSLANAGCEDLMLESCTIPEQIQSIPPDEIPPQDKKYLDDSLMLAQELEKNWTDILEKFDFGQTLLRNKKTEQYRMLKGKEFCSRARLEELHLRLLRLLNARHKTLLCRISQRQADVDTLSSVIVDSIHGTDEAGR